MSKGQVTIQIIVAIATTSGLTAGLGWNMLKTVELAEQAAATNKAVEGIEAMIGEMRVEQGDLSKNLIKMTTDVAVMKKAMELYSPNVGLNFKLAERLATTTNERF